MEHFGVTWITDCLKNYSSTCMLFFKRFLRLNTTNTNYANVCCGVETLKDVVSIASGEDENIFVYAGPDLVSAVCPRIQNRRPGSGHTRRKRLFYANFPGIFA